MHCVLTAKGALALTTANPGFSDNVWKLNSILTPFPAGGYELAYYDELAALYYHYRVLSSSISVEVHPGNTATTNIAIFPDQAATAVADIWIASEKPLAKCITSVAGSGRLPTATLMARPIDIQINDPKEDAASTNADPANVSYWHVTVAPEVAAAAAVTLYVKIMMEVLFDGPKATAS